MYKVQCVMCQCEDKCVYKGVREVGAILGFTPPTQHQHTPKSLHDGSVHPLGQPVQHWSFRDGVFEPNSLRPTILFELSSVFSSVVCLNRFQLPSGFSFDPAWNSLKTDNTWSFVFIGEAHSFRLWSSINVTNYCNPACDFLSTWHTSVCISSNNAFRLIGGLIQKKVWFILSVSPFSSGIFGTVYSSQIPFDRQYSSKCPR